MADPFALLGVPETASVDQIRTAFRRLALRYHPDRNPGDPRAGERFKRILRAYRAALSAGPRAPKNARPPAGPRPDRFGCPSCGDTFPFSEPCPRCGIDVYDRHASAAPEVEDARVRAWVSRMEKREPLDDVDLEGTVPLSGLLCIAFFGLGAAVFSFGPLPPALLLIGFAVYLALTEGQRMLPPAWARSS